MPIEYKGGRTFENISEQGRPAYYSVNATVFEKTGDSLDAFLSLAKLAQDNKLDLTVFRAWMMRKNHVITVSKPQEPGINEEIQEILKSGSRVDLSLSTVSFFIRHTKQRKPDH